MGERPPDWGLNLGTLKVVMRDAVFAQALGDCGVDIDEEEIEVNGSPGDFWDFLCRRTVEKLHKSEHRDVQKDQKVSWDEFKRSLIRIMGRTPTPKDMLRTRCAAERVSRRLAIPSKEEAMKKLKLVATDMEDVDVRLAALNTQLKNFLAW